MKKRIVSQQNRSDILDKKHRAKDRQLIGRKLILIVGLVWTSFIIKELIDLMVFYNKQIATVQEKDHSIQVSGQQSTEQVRVVSREALNKGNLILVNDSHPIYKYNDEDLVTIGNYLKGVCKMKSTEIKLREEVVTALRELIIDFNEVVGENDLTVISGYRDFNTQERLHYESLLEEREDDTVFVSRPDRSEHHTGMAVDFGLCYKDGTCEDYDGTGIYNWINENAYKYGFIMRYDEKKKDKTGIGYEPWHFRYVGKVHAGIMKELGLCLEEYTDLLKNYSYYKNPGQGITTMTQGYSIYYVPCEHEMTNIPVPIGKNYTISGNNEDGYIVTVDLMSEYNESYDLN